MQTRAFVGGHKGCPRPGLSPTLPALFPLRCFLSPSLSEFNEDNEISQAHFALQQLSNTFLTREKGQKRSGGAGEEPPRSGSLSAGRDPHPRGRGRCARRPGLSRDAGLTPALPRGELEGGCSAPLHRLGSAPSSPAPAPRRGSIKKKND